MSDNSDNAAKVLSRLEAVSPRKQSRSVSDPIALAIHQLNAAKVLSHAWRQCLPEQNRLVGDPIALAIRQLLHPLFKSSAKAFNI